MIIIVYDPTHGVQIQPLARLPIYKLYLQTACTCAMAQCAILSKTQDIRQR